MGGAITSRSGAHKNRGSIRANFEQAEDEDNDEDAKINSPGPGHYIQSEQLSSFR